MERAYTVAEIDALRRAHTDKYLYGSYRLAPSRTYISRPHKAEELTAIVEQLVRTSMLAGHTAEDLMA